MTAKKDSRNRGFEEKAHLNVDQDAYGEGWDRIFKKKNKIESVFSGFSDFDHMKTEFNIEDKDLSNIDWMFAEYIQESYEGSSFILFSREGKLYEVNGSHCSCHGLEGQWIEEETSLDSLDIRTLSDEAIKFIQRVKENK